MICRGSMPVDGPVALSFDNVGALAYSPFFDQYFLDEIIASSYPQILQFFLLFRFPLVFTTLIMSNAYSNSPIVIGRAFMLVFQSITLEGWTEYLYNYGDARGPMAYIYFLSLVLFVSYILLNMFTGGMIFLSFLFFVLLFLSFSLFLFFSFLFS